MTTELGVFGTMTVNEAVRRYPATIAVFNAFGIDTCCGGGSPIEEAGVRDGADPAELLRALRQAIEEAGA